MLFLFVFGIITCVFILKQLLASGSVIIGEYSQGFTCDFKMDVINRGYYTVAKRYEFYVCVART